MTLKSCCDAIIRITKLSAGIAAYCSLKIYRKWITLQAIQVIWSQTNFNLARQHSTVEFVNIADIKPCISLGFMQVALLCLLETVSLDYTYISSINLLGTSCVPSLGEI